MPEPQYPRVEIWPQPPHVDIITNVEKPKPHVPSRRPIQSVDNSHINDEFKNVRDPIMGVMRGRVDRTRTDSKEVTYAFNKTIPRLISGGTITPHRPEDAQF